MKKKAAKTVRVRGVCALCRLKDRPTLRCGHPFYYVYMVGQRRR